MRLVFMDEEWRVFYDRLQKVRHDAGNNFQDKEYNLHEEMTKRYNQLYSCNLSVEEFKKGLSALYNNCYEAEDDEGSNINEYVICIICLYIGKTICENTRHMG